MSNRNLLSGLHTAILAACTVSIFSVNLVAQTYDLKEFFPLVNGRNSTYLCDDINVIVEGETLTATGNQSNIISSGGTIHQETVTKLIMTTQLTGQHPAIGSFIINLTVIDYYNWTDSEMHWHRRDQSYSGSLGSESDSVTLPTPFSLLPRYLALGETYTGSYYDPSDGQNYHVYVKLLGKEFVQTNSGLFECLKLNFSGDLNNETWFLARDMGPVMISSSLMEVLGVPGDDIKVRLNQTNYPVVNLPVDLISYPMTQQSSWLQTYYIYGAGWTWCWHPALGWFYGDVQNAGCWLYFIDHEWVYSSESWFPFAFSAKESRWFWVDNSTGTFYPL